MSNCLSVDIQIPPIALNPRSSSKWKHPHADDASLVEVEGLVDISSFSAPKDDLEIGDGHRHTQNHLMTSGTAAPTEKADEKVNISVQKASD